jgi:hypothetical protein
MKALKLLSFCRYLYFSYYQQKNVKYNKELKQSKGKNITLSNSPLFQFIRVE